MARRRKQKRQLKKTIYIVCEGKNTEPIYFGGIIEKINEIAENTSFQVVVYDTCKNDPIGLINEARSLIETETNDEAWAVFDKDGYTKHKEAFILASETKPTVNIAFSSIAFEQWILLHFEKSLKQYKKSRNIIERIRNQKYISHYTKKASINLFKILEDKTIDAIENCAWLKHKVNQEESDELFNLNPYSDVDILIKKLLNIDKTIKWHNLKDGFSIDKIQYQLLEYAIDNETLNATLKIINASDKTYIINNQNLILRLEDDQNNHYKPILNETIEIKPKENFTINFDFNTKPNKNIYKFIIEKFHEKHIIELNIL